MFCNLSVRLSTLPALALLALAACNQSDDTAAPSARECGVPGDTPVHLPGGTFTMGDNAVYPQEEGPPRETTVGGFWIDPHEVTNRQFAEFVDATDYVTVAEKPVDPAVFGVPASQIPAELLLPGSAVFVAPDHPTSNPNDWWFYTPGANWRFPFGPDGPAQVADEPVVHLAYEDMLAYAAWRGGRLPTEAEWEYAATAGAGHYSDQPTEANSWQGLFPVVNEDTDGFVGIAPVGCFAPNPSGLYDMIGNVWEVTSDFYAPGHDPNEQHDPQGPSEQAAFYPANPHTPSRVMKGGSFLCAPNYCQRYRPSARDGRDPTLGASNVGFRLVYDHAPAA